MLRKPIKAISIINNVQERKLDQQKRRWMIYVWHISVCDLGTMGNMEYAQTW
jgi:hypothetical protein